jgi:hypothetical protein
MFKVDIFFTFVWHLGYISCSAGVVIISGIALVKTISGEYGLKRFRLGYF